MAEKHPITKKGYETLKAELKHLTTVERPKVVQDIAEARAHGDLKENAEYHAAKERQSFVEGRIAEINGKMANMEVIDPITLEGTKIVFGATVTLLDMDSEEEFCYQLVGEDEADLKDNKISYNSPIARALIGKSKGDEVTIRIPKGKMDVEILEVKFK